MRCTFIHSPDMLYAVTQNYGAKFMPIWAFTLASHLAEKLGDQLELDLLDTQLEKLNTVKPSEVFLFSGYNQDEAALLSSLRHIKGEFPDSVTFIGGPICWSYDKSGELKKLFDFDHIFLGDGEETVSYALKKILDGTRPDKVISPKTRFDIREALPLYKPLLDKTIHRYYGGIVEVSRGCPFLCEFCDVRVLPDNNRTHTKAPGLIISEIDYFVKKGISKIMFACDNFIGDPALAEEVVDEIIEWKKSSAVSVAIYTWLTINLYKHPGLMKKLRLAGFDMVFIGIESFSENSLLEMSKVQNPAEKISDAVKTIQSYGFIVVAGLIFGFDSDEDDCFDMTLKGLEESGLLSGDPTLLTALPGTPLYHRMKLAGRVRNVRFGLGGFKYQTNIRYIQDKDFLINGFRKFVAENNDGSYQFNRFKGYLDNLRSENYTPLNSEGFGSLSSFLKMTLANPIALKQMSRRVFRFVSQPAYLFHLTRALIYLFKNRDIQGGFTYLRFWAFVWTNNITKYAKLKYSDFDVETINRAVTPNDILPDGYSENFTEEIPEKKIHAQRRTTTRQLKSLIDRKQNLNPSGKK